MDCQIKNTTERYGSVAKFFHWLIFLLLLVMIIGGFFLDEVPKEYKGVIYNLHKLTGLTILILMVLRILWALINPVPTLANMSSLARLTAKAMHYSLYLAVLAMPMVGWIGSSAAGKGPHLGDAALNLPVPASKELAESMFEAHEVIAYIIIVLVSLHIAAALYHHYVMKDNILRRMLPGNRLN